MSVWPFAVVLLLTLINALYVAAEFAMVGVRITRVEQFAAQGNRLAMGALPILRDPARLDRYISASQIGITLSSLVLGAFGQATIAIELSTLLVALGWLEPVGALALSATVVLAVLSSIQVVFGELIPKILALQYPVGALLYTLVPMRWSLTLYAPLIDLLNGSGNLVLRRFGVNARTSARHVHAPGEIDLLIRESCAGGLLEAKDSNRLREALRLGRHTVRQLMVSRRQILSLDLDAPLEQLLAQIHASPYTRLLVYQGRFEDVRGFLHVKDVALAIASGREPVDLPSLVRPLLALPSKLTIDRALGQLRDHRARIALVVSEFGDLEGLISLEDIIRELLGELTDEFKSMSDLAPEALPDGRWRLPGRLPLDEALEWAQGLGTPAWEPSEAETLAGWLLERLDAIPQAGCRLAAAGLDFEIEDMDGAAISSVLVQVPRAGAGGADD